MRNDPGELTNLVNSTRAQPALQHLRETLLQLEKGFPAQFRGGTTKARNLVTSTNPLALTR